MSTHNRNLALIRQRLLQPDDATPTDLQLLNILLEKVADHSAQLLNSRNHWMVARTTIQALNGVEDYPINAADFGRPFLVYTTDSTDPYHVRREIPFTLLQDADQRYWGPQQLGVMKHSAAEIAFYRRTPAAPAWYARFVPIPGDSATYDCWYESNYDTDAVSLGDNAGLSPFHHLVRAETALAALPACAWGSISLEQDMQRWQMRIQVLSEAFARDIAMYQKQFDSYKAQVSREGVSQKRGVGHEYEEDWGFGIGSMTNRYGW